MAYIGSAEDARRIRKQEEEREKQKQEFEKRKQQGESNVDGAGLRQFGAGTTDVLEAAFKNETVGLATREEFLNKRNTLKDRQLEEAKRKREQELQLAAEKAERQKKKARKEAKTKLSFFNDEDAQLAEDEEGSAEAEKVGVGAVKQAVVIPKVKKNPEAETSFLPDRDREMQEEALRRQIETEYELREQSLKSEPLEVTYSYFDGSGHRRVITVKRGNTIGEFLKQVRDELAQEFKDIRNVSVNNLIYVKEDFMIPHNLTFHELIKRKSGALADFGAHEDIRAHSDSRIANTETHAGKVLTRGYYDRNKHIYPASKWELLTEV